MAQQVVTANRLGDGTVVYLTADAQWSERLAEAGIHEDDQAAQAALVRAQDDEVLQVVDAYLIAVAANGTGLRLTNVREHIRAQGPSVRRDHGQQTETQITAPWAQEVG